MAPLILYIACLLGALGLYLVMRPGRPGGLPVRPVRVAGALIGLAGLGALFTMGPQAMTGAGEGPNVFFTIFAVLSIAAAVRMIATDRPVYAALYFVLVVIASAGLFLLLEAEFMTFALIIVYAGAILITYMFVLMLAQQAPEGDETVGAPEYDRNPREPAAGAVVGFVLLALLSRMIIDGAAELPAPPSATEAMVSEWDELRGLPRRIEEQIERTLETPAAVELVADPADGRPRLEPSPDGRTATAWALVDGTEVAVELPAEARPENVQSVGIGLIVDFPVSLELAGIILLMAMFGAVILARRQIELTEDEKLEAAGMERIGHHDETGWGGGS